MERDMTRGNPTKLILLFAFPMLLGNICQQMYNVVDTLIVGRFIGKNALAAVGSSFAVMVFITSIIIGLCMGAGIVMSQLYGAKEYEKLKRTIVTSVIFIGTITILITFIMIFFLDEFLIMFQMPKEIFYDSKSYLTVIFMGLIFIFLYNVSTCILRAVGNSKTPLYFLILSAILNIIFDLFFVLVLDKGVKGVAIATILAQGIAASLSLLYAIKKLSFMKLTCSDIKFDGELFKMIAQYSMLTSIQQSIMNFGILMIQGLVNTFGLSAMAAFAAAVKIESFAYMPVQDFGNAFSTYVAQNIGGGHINRVRDGVKSSIKTILVFCTIISVSILIFSTELMVIFINKSETEVISIGVQYLSIVGMFYLFIGFLFMFYGFYRGVGYLKMSIALTVVSLGTRVAIAYMLAPTMLGLQGIWWAIPTGWIIADIIGFITYKKGKWIINFSI